MSYSEFLEQSKYAEVRRSAIQNSVKEIEKDITGITIRTLYQENKFDDLFNFMYGTLFIVPNPAERDSLWAFRNTIRTFDRPNDISTSRISRELLHYLGYDILVLGESKDKHGYGFDTHKFLLTINFFYYEATIRIKNITKNSEMLEKFRQAIYAEIHP